MAIIDFGDALRGWRREAGLTQEQLAALCGVDRASVSRIEAKKIYPQIDTVSRIMEALSKSAHDLADALEGYRPGWEMRTGPDGTERPVLLTEPAVIAESRITYGENLEHRVAALEAELDVHRRLASLETRLAALAPVETEAQMVDRIRAEALKILDAAGKADETPTRRSGKG